MPSRRHLLSALGTACVALAGCAASATRRVSGTWPQFGRTAANTGTTSVRGPTETVERRWSTDLKLPLRKTPVVSGGRVFVGGLDRFVALDAATGREDWRVSIPRAQRFNDSAAAVGDGSVVAGFGHVLRAHDAATGEQAWTERPGDGISAPTLRNGTLYVAVGGTGRVEARSLADGSLSWSAPVGEWIPGPPALAGDTLLAAGARREDPGVIRGLATADGAERWTLDIDPAARGDDGVRGNPSGVSAGRRRAYVGLDDGSVWAIRVDDGKRVWRFNPGSTLTYEGPGGPRTSRPAVRAPPAVGDGRVYVAHGDGRLYALDAASGEVAWSFWAWNGLPAQPSVGDGAVYVGSEDSFVYALDPRTGDRLWEYATSGSVEGALAVVDGHVVAASGDEHVRALGGDR